MDLSLKNAADGRIFEKLVPIVKGSDFVFTYVSTDIEVDTKRLIAYCFDNGIRVAVPVSLECTLDFYEIHGFDDLAEGRYNILEPVKRDSVVRSTERSVCIVPALCADESGLRLGYGKGYYDRYLSDFKGKSVIICYSNFRMEVPAELHDRRADLVIFD